jgi:SPP1 family predicted phage head-tail adaptor
MPSGDLRIRAGDLRHRVTLQSPTVTQNDLGEDTTTWPEAGTFWAAVNPLSGNELFRAKQVNAEVTHEIEMRWTPLVTPANRIKFGTRIFEILSAINVEERNKKLLLSCKEHING